MIKFFAYLLVFMNVGPSSSLPIQGQGVSVHELGNEVGKVADNNEIQITLNLGLDNERELDQFLGELYQPGHPNYHKFLSSDEFHNKYAPSDARVEQIKGFLEKNGLQLTSISDNRLLVHAKGPASVLNSVFGTTLYHYQNSDGTLYRSPNSEIQIPASLKIHSVHGLHNTTVAKRSGAALRASPGLGNGSFLVGTGPSGGLSPSDIRSIYGIPTTHGGSGQVFGLFQFDGFFQRDVNNYIAQFKQPNVLVRTVLTNGATGLPSRDANGALTDGAAEVALDIQMTLALAPHAAQIVVYESSQNGDVGAFALNTFNKMASDNLARTLSSSWEITNEFQALTALAESFNSVLKQMAAQGQTLFVASGDKGAYNQGQQYSPTTIVGVLATQPYAVIVGGTSLNRNANGSIAETAWTGSGGGISPFFNIPSWQQAAISPMSLGSLTMRNVPDVSLNADPNSGYSINLGGNWYVYGGTSAASPLWSAFIGIANEIRQGHSLGPIGFLNPTVYQPGSAVNQYVHDIVSGENGFYPAILGFDDATGWGSFNGNLLVALGGGPTTTSSTSTTKTVTTTSAAPTTTTTSVAPTTTTTSVAPTTTTTSVAPTTTSTSVASITTLTTLSPTTTTTRDSSATTETTTTARTSSSSATTPVSTSSQSTSHTIVPTHTAGALGLNNNNRIVLILTGLLAYLGGF